MPVRAIAALGLLIAAGGVVAGCSSTFTSTPEAQHATSRQATSSAPAQTSSGRAQAPTLAAGAPSAPVAAAGDVATYQPSEVVTQTSHYTLLHTSDGVARVTSFYDSQFASGGWTIVSKYAGPYSGTFTARKSGHGASVSIYPVGGGSSISISTY
jgi:hypothetical protein